MTSHTTEASKFLSSRASVHRGWRQHLHQNPEVAFEETDTSRFIEGRLGEMGIPISARLAKTGLVASLSGNQAGRSIGFRADMDALPLQEQSNLPYKSQRQGVSHACGHDGHMAMLLAAADYLAHNRDFPGTIHFIFQPAEEAAGGGRVMVEEGLFGKADCEMVFGLHNWPSLEVGTVAVRAGHMMAAMDLFKVVITGKGVHAALPYLGTDAIVAAGALTQSLQSIVSRAIDPHDQLVLSITQIHGGHSLNALPDTVELRGTLRYFEATAAAVAHKRIHDVADGIAKAHNVEIAVDLRSQYPVTTNHSDAAKVMQLAALAAPGCSRLVEEFTPSMASEDFAFMLAARKGAYAWIGSGSDTALHNPAFNFNDVLIPFGAGYWIALAQACATPKLG